jgi:D-alanyl-D-alanine carboxypeptidase/D-alanyl-D-alanine-endopeptidase (penicillin-binding protein 4)
MDDAVSDSKILYYGKFEQKKLPEKNVYLVDSVKRDVSEVAKDVLQNSNNMAAETLFKVAGGKYVNNTGSINSAVDMLKSYCQKNKIDYDDIRIVDGSGVSKNNLMTAAFMTEFLETTSKSEDFEKYYELMATPGTGTLKDRMLYLGDKLKAKTGTLSDVSAIAGFITTRRGNKYAFDVMINDHKSSPADKKQLEEYLLRAIFADM